MIALTLWAILTIGTTVSAVYRVQLALGRPVQAHSVSYFFSVSASAQQVTR